MNWPIKDRGIEMALKRMGWSPRSGISLEFCYMFHVMSEEALAIFFRWKDIKMV